MNRFKYYAFKLSGICVIVFLLQLLIPGFTELFLLNADSWYQPWRFLTAMFLHGDIAHLLYNIFALTLFGSVLERLVRTRKFLFIFFVSGILANLIAVNFYFSSLGASGAIFGIIGALIIVRPMLTAWAFGIPMPIFIAGILWGAGDALGAVAFLTGNPISNTGNFAHLSGMIVGLIFGLFFRDWRHQGIKRERFYVDESSVRRWEDNWMR